MNPLSSSSLNAERSRVDASRSAPTPDPASAPDAASGGFAALLRGAQTGAQTAAAPETAAPGLTPWVDAPALPGAEVAKPANAAAAPTTAAAQDDVKARHVAPQRQPVAPTEQASDSVAEHDDASAQDKDVAATTGDTLAHWLLSQGAYLADAAQAVSGSAGGLPPPQNAAMASDDVKAAALAREVLDGVRSRAKAASAGKLGSVPAGARADDADTLRRDAVGGLKTGRTDEGVPGLVAASASEPSPVVSARQTAASERFEDQLTAALQAPMPEPAVRLVETGASRFAATVAVEQSIDTPLQHPGFGEAVGVTLSQLARNGVHEARLQLNPAELGPVSVHIAMNGQEARIELGAAQAQTRAMLDASLPALTEAFRADGLVLAASQVSDWQDPRAAAANQGSQGSAASGGQGHSGAQAGAHSGAGGGQERGTPTRSGWVGRTDGGDVPLPAPASWGGRGLGGLDLYA